MKKTKTTSKTKTTKSTSIDTKAKTAATKIIGIDPTPEAPKSSGPISGRNLLIALSVKYKGDFNKMLKAIKEKERIEADEVDKLCSTVKTDAITILDEEYPESLKRVHMPPLVLFLKGDKSLLSEDNKKLAVIGSRDYSEYGAKATKDLVSGILSTKNKPVIISGLARGIDAIAHDTTLVKKGKTIAVVANGLDVQYPRQNAALYNKIADAGLLISEYPDCVDPQPEHFTLRNRIVAALADKVLVTEAAINSGTTITVMYALSMGKDVMAVPTAIDSKYGCCNKLIQDGAYLVKDVEDLKFLLEGK